MQLSRRKHKVSVKGSFIGFFTILILLLLATFILYPLCTVIFTSFKSNAEVMVNPVGFPRHITVANYPEAFVMGGYANAFLNTLKLAIIGATVSVAMSSFMAFVLTRPNFRTRKYLYLFIIAGMVVPTNVCALTAYIQMSAIGLVNSHLSVLCMHVAYGLSFLIFIIAGFFKGIPTEINEAAVLDGCSEMGIYLWVTLPLSIPIIITGLIFQMVGIWNDMFFSMIFLGKESLKTLPLGTMKFHRFRATDYSGLFAYIIMCSVPMFLAFIIMQKQFVDGLTAGAIKG